MTSGEGRRVEVDARPHPFEISPQSTAVVVVDMQHDFAHLVVAKHRYSGFFETDLDAMLRDRGTTPSAELTQLAQLHSQGILTDEEFGAKKAQILGI